MKVHIFRAGETLSEFDLAEGEYLIGSGESAQLRLPGDTVAPEHARLKIGTGCVEVEDLGSGRGTFLGELALTGAQPVPDGAILQCGDVGLQFRDDQNPASAAPEPAEQGRYVIGEIVAKGAMGMIRRARELSTGREVAMKQMHEEMADGSAAGAARFVQEAKITAHLEHPNVVPVHDVGHGAGGPSFYTMKLVRGISLEKVLDLLTQRTDSALKKYPLEALLTIFQKVCDAVAFAHSKGIIHRDLKPANLMVGEYGEVLVMDWGLAKLVGEAAEELSAEDSAAFTAAVSSNVTLAGTVMGTPYYMAPEQAAGDIALVDERSDIYALGAILYELLTLQTSVEGRGSREVLQKVRDGKITPLLQRAGQTPLAHLPGGKIPASLAAVAMKALAYSPERRYQRVTDLQAEIRAFQSGFATGAESAGTWRQLTLLVKRHKAVATAIAASVVLIGVLTAIYTAAVVREGERANIQRDKATAALTQTEVEKKRAESASEAAQTQRDLSEERLYFSHMLLAGKDLAEGRPENARNLLERHTVEPSGRDLRDWEWYYLSGQLSQETLRVQAHRGGANGLAVSPDGSRAATVGDDGSVAIWAVAGFREMARWTAHADSVLCVAWSPDMAYLATGDVRGDVRVWEIATGKKSAEFHAPAGGAVRAVAWCPDRSGPPRLAIAGDRKEIVLWDPAKPVSGSNPEQIAMTNRGTHALSWAEDGRRLAAGLADTGPATVVFESTTKARIFGMNAPAGSDVHAVAFNPKNGLLAVGAKHLYVAVYDPAPQPSTISNRPLHRGFVSSVAWKPDGSLLASGSYDGTIRVTNPRNPSDAPLILAGDVGRVNALAWMTLPASEAGGKSTSVILSANADGTLRAWLGERVNGQTFAADLGNWVATVKWSPTGSLLAVANFRDVVRIYNAATGEEQRPLKGQAGLIFDAAWSPDGTRLASAGRGSGCVSIFDTKSGAELFTLRQPKPSRVAWSPDGRYLAVCGNSPGTGIWDTQNGKLLHTLARAGSQAEWHPDGRRLALGCRDGGLEIWDGLTGKGIETWRKAPAQPPGAVANEFEPACQVAALAWSRQGDRLAYVTQDTVAAVLDAASGLLLREFSGHTGAISRVVWSGDGRRVATSGQDGTVRIYNSSTGDQVALVPHGDGTKETFALDWSQDGRSLVTGGFDRFARVWDTNRGRDLAAARKLQSHLAQRPGDVAAAGNLATLAARLGWADTARTRAAQAGPAALQAAEAELAIALHARSSWRPSLLPTPTEQAPERASTK